jgi:predicted aspartyl protease
MECYSTYVKLTKVRTLGREVIAEVLNSPVVDKNLIGEGLLKKLQQKIDYKNMRIDDP